MYHPAVRFTVAPFSIKHDFEPSTEGNDRTSNGLTVAKLINPIPSCDHKRTTKLHTDYNMISERGREAQLASGKVLFTYDVTWIENLELEWATRWDIYLSMGDAIPDQVYWFLLANSLVVVLVLSATIAAYLLGDFARYNEVAIDEEESVQKSRKEI